MGSIHQWRLYGRIDVSVTAGSGAICKVRGGNSGGRGNCNRSANIATCSGGKDNGDTPFHGVYCTLQRVKACHTRIV